jgi:hypothetical protein
MPRSKQFAISVTSLKRAGRDPPALGRVREELITTGFIYNDDPRLPPDKDHR